MNKWMNDCLCRIIWIQTIPLKSVFRVAHITSQSLKIGLLSREEFWWCWLLCAVYLQLLFKSLFLDFLYFSLFKYFVSARNPLILLMSYFSFWFSFWLSVNIVLSKKFQLHSIVPEFGLQVWSILKGWTASENDHMPYFFSSEVVCYPSHWLVYEKPNPQQLPLVIHICWVVSA